MPLPRLRSLLGIATFASATLLAAPAAVLADCVAPPSFDEARKTAPIVFVGTVTETSNEDRWATVSVEEIWNGPDLARTLLIKGGPDPGSGTSMDRTFQVGVRYFFVPVPSGDGNLADTTCTSTQPWEEWMAEFRPADARLGEVEVRNDLTPIDLGFVVGIGGVLLVVAAVMLGVGLLARGRSD